MSRTSWPTPIQLVIFDCDGVLVDSEALSRTVLIAEAARLGATLTEADAHAVTGLRWTDVQPIFTRMIGQVLPASWPLDMQTLLIAAMDSNLKAIPGAAETLVATASLGLPYRVASNSSHEEMVEKFTRTGLLPFVSGRLHSARDVGIGKPAPDLFLAAARAQGVPPNACLVVEDSAPGIAAAAAAGMRCVAYAPVGDHAHLRAIGAEPIASLAELPAILRAALHHLAA